MKDVSKQTLEDLTTFIYHGEVNLNQDDLEVFFNTANALEIKGLIDGSQTPKSLWFESLQNGYQYQSSRTVQVGNSAPLNYYQQPSDGLQQQDDFDCGENNASAEKGSELDNNQNDNMADGRSSTKRELNVQDDQWNSNYYGDNGVGQVPKTKRAKFKNGW